MSSSPTLGIELTLKKKKKELGFYPIDNIEPRRLLGRGVAVRLTF